MAFRREPGRRDPEAFDTFVEVLIGILAATLMTLLAAAAMVWREDAVGSAARILTSMIYTALIVAGQHP